MNTPDFEALAERATINVSAFQDDTPVRGNVMASGDDAADEAAENEVLARLNDGDIWAWASVTVEARFGDFVGKAHLGCCTYLHMEDFKTPGGYYDDMVTEAREDLAGELRRAWRTLTERPRHG